MKYLIAFCCSLLLSMPALAQPAVLLGPDLESAPVRLQSMTSDAINVVNSRGDVQQLEPSDVLRLTFSRNATPMPAPGSAVVTLRDGQVLVGKLVPSKDEEAVRIKLDANRVVQVSLDEMLSLVMENGATVPAVDEDDALLLATGEVLLGFVETLSEDAIGFVIGDADDAIQIPTQRIKAVAIANKPRAAEAKKGMMRIASVDGSVLLLEEVRLSPNDELVGMSTLPIFSSRRADEDASADASRMVLPLNRVLMIEPVSSRFRIAMLNVYDRDIVSGGEVFGVAMPPRVTAAGDLRLNAPVEIAYDLPRGARRMAFTVAMDLDASIPESRRAMAGCELLVYLGEEVVAKHTLTPDGPAKRLNIPLTTTDLRIALMPGVNGPVLDRVVISQAELLVSN